MTRSDLNGREPRRAKAPPLDGHVCQIRELRSEPVPAAPSQGPYPCLENRALIFDLRLPTDLVSSPLMGMVGRAHP